MWEQPIEDKYMFTADERNTKSLINYLTYTQELPGTIQRIKTIKGAEETETDLEFVKLENGKTDWTLEERWITFKETLLKITEKLWGKRKYSKHVKRTRWWNSDKQRLTKDKKTA
uniref:Uncharacterized protein n=1 Tax=Photinus pyralis TaxID=7054 RepID=A0A1Y1MTH6_PHOPY